MSKTYIFTSESVTEGHPDKVSDHISDAILDEFLRQDPDSRVAVETLVTTNFVTVAGEVTSKGKFDIEKVVRDTIAEIGYDDPVLKFDAKTCEVIIKIDPKIGYRATTVYGFNMVTFIDDITIRAEAGYFTTENNYQESWFLFFETKAEYVQYVIQFEYRTVRSSTIGAQLIGNHVLNAVGQTIDLVTMDLVAINTDNFVPGLGTPFAMIAEQSLSIVGSKTFFDENLELGYNLLINLEEKGQMVGVNVAYSLIENWSIDGSVSYFKGDDKLENSFEQLEDFSHFQFQLAYSF